MDDEIHVGDLVVLMLEPGPFRVVEVDGRDLVIEAATGVRRRVRDIAVRKVTGEPPVNR